MIRSRFIFFLLGFCLRQLLHTEGCVALEATVVLRLGDGDALTLRRSLVR